MNYHIFFHILASHRTSGLLEELYSICYWSVAALFKKSLVLSPSHPDISKHFIKQQKEWNQEETYSEKFGNVKCFQIICSKK